MGSDWHIHISGQTGTPDDDMIIAIRAVAPRVRLEISAPGIRSQVDDQRAEVRRAIQAILDDLQKEIALQSK